MYAADEIPHIIQKPFKNGFIANTDPIQQPGLPFTWMKI